MIPKLHTTTSQTSCTPIKNRRAPFAVTRSVVAVLLALALLVTAAPTSGSAVGEQVCSMTCCIGKPVHRSGECGMTGGETSGAAMSCHAGGDDDADKEFSHEVARAEVHTPATDDEWCGTGEVVRRHNALVTRRKRFHKPKSHLVESRRKGLRLLPLVATGIALAGDDSDARLAVVRPTSFNSPCDPGCGAGVTSVTVSGDTKQASPCSAYRPRPPTGAASLLRSGDPLRFTATRRTSASPRGPPASFS